MIAKNLGKKLYFGFGTVSDYPEWQSGFETSIQKDKVLKPEEYGQNGIPKNPFKFRLRHILEDYKKYVNIQETYHDVMVPKGEPIRPVVYEIARKLIGAGWELGDFNRNGAIDDIWEEHLAKKGLAQNER